MPAHVVSSYECGRSQPEDDMNDDQKTADQLMDAVLLMLAGEFDISAAGMQAPRMNLRRAANSLAV